jgi:hypothetical protein
MNLNFLESSGPLQACNGTALPLPLPFMVVKEEFLPLLIFSEGDLRGRRTFSE